MVLILASVRNVQYLRIVLKCYVFMVELMLASVGEMMLNKIITLIVFY
jgi:hypothetical protein